MGNRLVCEKLYFYLMRYQNSTHDQGSQKFSLGGERLMKPPPLAEELWQLKAAGMERDSFLREVSPVR